MDDDASPSKEDALPRMRDRFDTACTVARLAAFGIFRSRDAVANFCIAMLAVAIAACVGALLLSVTAISPLLFLSIAELSAGEVDLRIDYPLLYNFTAFNRSCSPRISDMAVTVYPTTACNIPANCSANALPPGFPYTGLCSAEQSEFAAECNAFLPHCLGSLCRPTAFSTSLHLIRSRSENAIGRSWPLGGNPIRPMHVIASRALADRLRLSINSSVFVVIPTAQLFRRNLHEAVISVGAMAFATKSIVGQFFVQEIYPSALGKLPENTKYFLFGELDSMLLKGASILHPLLNSTIAAKFQSPPFAISSLFCSAASDAVATPDSRLPYYLLKDYDSIARHIFNWASNITASVFNSIGTNNSVDNGDIPATLAEFAQSSSLPVLGALRRTRQYSSFVDLLLSLVIVFLIALCIYLIHSLLSVTVESRLSDLGTFRMLGLPRIRLLFLINIQALFHAAPGLCLGLLAAQVAFVCFKAYIEGILHIVVSPIISGSSTALAIVLAILVPLTASALPIRRVLELNILESLDRPNSAASPAATAVSVERASSSPMSNSIFAFLGLLLVSYGICIYYVMPFSLVTDNLVVLFNIFLVILGVMISGLVVLSLNVIPALEQLLSSILFRLVLFWESRVIYALVLSNLRLHRRRTSKTSLLYALSLSVIVSLSVTSSIQVSSLQFSLRRSLAADILVQSSARWSDGFPAAISRPADLEEFAAKSPHVRVSAWSTWNLAEISPLVEGITVSSSGRLAVHANGVFGVSASFFELFADPFLQTDALDAQLQALPLAEHLYSTTANSTGAIMGSYFKTRFAMEDQGAPPIIVLDVSYKLSGGDTTLHRESTLRPVLFADSFPKFNMPAVVSPSKAAHLVVSLAQFAELSEQFLPFSAGISELPMAGFYLSLIPGLPDHLYKQVVDDIRALTSYEDVIEVRDLTRGVDISMTALSLVFDLVTATILVILYFSLNSSMHVTIMEQRREIAILRALGLPPIAVYRLYFYEATMILMAASFMGISVGVIVGWTITAQQSMITQAPLRALFPWSLLGVVLAVSVLSAGLSVFFPVRSLVSKRRLAAALSN